MSWSQRFVEQVLRDPAVLNSLKKKATDGARKIYGDALVVSDGLPYGVMTVANVIEPFGVMPSKDTEWPRLEGPR
jgi:hypothetical protein